jgi:hypothetical protein
MSRTPTTTLCVTLALALGCRAQTPGPLDAPAPSQAKTALVASLDSWKDGRRDSGGLIGKSPAVGVVDTLRPERPLESYEVLDPASREGPARSFVVRLGLGDPAEEITTRYLVVGQDPLWVFRQEDYDLILHWEHKMPAEDRKASP